MPASGFAFVFRTSRLELLLGYAGALASVLVGSLLTTLGMGREQTWQVAALLAAAVALFVLCFVVLRRVLLQAYELRLGEAGAWFSTLLMTRSLSWDEIVQARLEGRTLRVVYRAGRTLLEVWVAIHDDGARFRLEAFLKRQAMRERIVPTP